MPHRFAPLEDLTLAFGVLTAFPVRAEWPERARGDVAGYFPLVGVVLGAIAMASVAVLRAAGWHGGSALVVAVAIVGAWALCTRMLHWDGLADTADGFWGSEERERRLEIMRDSHTGAFGATAIALLAVAQIGAVSSVVGVGAYWGLLAAPVMGRLSATFAAWLIAPARSDGFGAAVAGRPEISAVIPAALAEVLVFAVAYVLGGWVAVAICLGAEVSALLIPVAISRRFGGVTGDVMGASVLLAETATLCAVALIG